MSPKRGEIYWATPDDARGAIPAIRHPCVVLQDDVFNGSRLATTIVCGITTNAKRAGEPGVVALAAGEGGLERASYVVASQLSVIEKSALVDRIGQLSAARVDEIISSLRSLQRAFPG